MIHSNGFEIIDPTNLSEREFINCDGARVGRFTEALQCVGTGNNVEFRLQTRPPVIHPRLYAKDLASLPTMTIAVGYFVHIFDKGGHVVATRRLQRFTFERLVVRPGTSSGLVCSSNADLFILDFGGITPNGRSKN